MGKELFSSSLVQYFIPDSETFIVSIAPQKAIQNKQLLLGTW